MGIKIYEEIEKYLDTEEKKAYEILCNLIVPQDAEEHVINVENQFLEYKDYSFEQVCEEIKNGEFFLARFREFYVQYDEYNNNFHNQDTPNDEALNRVAGMILSSILVQGVYKDLGLDCVLKIIDSVESGISHASLLLYFPKPDTIIDHCERIKEEIIRWHNEREFFYWDKEIEKLQELHNILKDRGLIRENKRFVESFRNENVPCDLRTEWTSNGAKLVFLTYYLFKGLFGTSFYKMTFRLFYISHGCYTVDFLRQTYHHIKNEFDHPEKVSKNRKELIEIKDKIDF